MTRPVVTNGERDQETILVLTSAGVRQKSAADDAKIWLNGGRRFFEFFTVNIRNPNTRKAYFRAVAGFAAWCEERGLFDLPSVTPMHIAAYIEQLGQTHAKPTVKQHLAAVRMLFD